MSGNTSLAEAYRLDLLNSGKVSTAKSLLIFPPDLGKVPGWTQFNFNLFWLNIISGMNPKDAKKIELDFKNSDFDFITYNNSKLQNGIRKELYLKFVQRYLQLIKQERIKVNPISEFIQLVDPKGSLGGFVEEFLAKSLGVHISRVVINNMRSFTGEEAARNLIKQGIEIPIANISSNKYEPLLVVSQPLLFDSTKTKGTLWRAIKNTSSNFS